MPRSRYTDIHVDNILSPKPTSPEEGRFMQCVDEIIAKQLKHVPDFETMHIREEANAFLLDVQRNPDLATYDQAIWHGLGETADLHRPDDSHPFAQIPQENMAMAHTVANVIAQAWQESFGTTLPGDPITASQQAEGEEAWRGATSNRHYGYDRHDRSKPDVKVLLDGSTLQSGLQEIDAHLQNAAIQAGRVC